VLLSSANKKSNNRGRQEAAATAFTFYPQRNFYSSVAVIKSTGAETNL
jgi:hypothetical protein